MGSLLVSSFIQDRVISLGSLRIRWDWFEVCKWLNFFGGVFLTCGVVLVFVLDDVWARYEGNNFIKVFSIIALVSCLGLFVVLNKISGIIRDDVLK